MVIFLHRIIDIHPVSGICYQFINVSSIGRVNIYAHQRFRATRLRRTPEACG